MRLVSFMHQSQKHLGIAVGEEVVSTSQEEKLPHDMLALLAMGDKAMHLLRVLENNPRAKRYPLSEVTLLAPIKQPDKFLGVGLNYVDHIAETGVETPKFPPIFCKQRGCIIGPDAPIHFPVVSDKLDYEAELGVVIGRRCRHVTEADAARVIAGYLCVNDVTVRDWQMHAPTWTMGKSFDTHGPIGPWIVTADALADPHQLAIKTWVNNELRQSFNTKNLLFNCYQLIAYLSSAMTLEPGDIIATGTSSGSGFKMEPRAYLKASDVVRIEIEGVGVLENPVIKEPTDLAFIA